MDEEYGGLRNGHLIILGSRPAMGKTSLAYNIITEACGNRQKCLLFSLSEPENVILRNLTTIASNIPYYPDTWEDEERQKRNLVAMEMLSGTLHIECNATEMDAITDLCKRERPELIVIDYLQLIDTGTFSSNKKAVKNILKRLKKIAIKCCCPVLLLTQLSRQVEYRLSGEPVLDDLPGFKNAIKYADEVFFLYREFENEPEKTYLKVAKHVDGRIGTVEMAFDVKLLQFHDYTKTAEIIGEKYE